MALRLLPVMLCVERVHSPSHTVSVHLDDLRLHSNTYLYSKGEGYDNTSRGRTIR